MTLTIHDLHPGDGVKINTDPYRGAYGTVEAVGNDPAEFDVDGTIITPASQWARVVINDGVREYRTLYDLADLEKLRSPTTRRTHAPFKRGDLAAYSKADSQHHGHTVTVLGPAPYWPGEPEPRWNIRCPGTPTGGHTHDVEWITDEKYLTLLEPLKIPRPRRRITVSIDVTDDEIEWFDPWATTETRQLIATLDLLAENHDRLHIDFTMNPEERS